MIDFGWFFNHWLSRYNYFFGILRFLSITKDRKQLRIANKNYLVRKSNQAHPRIFTPRYCAPATAPEKGLDNPQV